MLLLELPNNKLIALAGKSETFIEQYSKEENNEIKSDESQYSQKKSSSEDSQGKY
jgi:hypothetical protein